MSRGQVIYEVNLWPDASIEEAFDEWLPGHVEAMLRLPGFVGATIQRVEEPGGDTAQRTVHYRLRDRQSLDVYFEDHAQRMRAEGVQRFGDRFRAERRILSVGRELEPRATSAACANCATPLYGQYCANCGQRARDRMISLWELVKEASEVLTSLDSRLWRSLGVLLFRPGRMTHDYLLGRRARYIPALRLFLGLSLLFFFLFSLDTRFEIVSDGPADGDPSLQLHMGGDEASESAVDTPVPAPEPRPPDAPGATDGTVDATPAPGESPPDGDGRPCEDIEVSWPGELAWMERWLSTDRVKSACEKIVADHGESFTRALLERIPAMMFLFLPLMAVVMKLLYPLARRFYVEHLLFLVHYHAFFYLLLSICILAGWIFSGGLLPHWPAQALVFLTMLYMPVYLFRAMRRVYAQGRIMTATKYLALGVAYFTSLLLFLLGTVTITAVTL